MTTVQRIILVASIVLSSATASAERKRQVRYVGIHPVPAAHGGGICHIEAPHVHVYAAEKLQYRDHDGANFFVGDPVAYGYDGTTYTYKGHHPIQVDVVVGDDEDDVEYCYLDGAHYHAFAPSGRDFKRAGGAYFFVGKPARAYVQARPVMVQINAIYKPLVYERPVVVAVPPVGWIGFHVDVVAPVLIVSPPAVIIHEHHFKHKKFKHKKFKHWH